MNTNSKKIEENSKDGDIEDSNKNIEVVLKAEVEVDEPEIEEEEGPRFNPVLILGQLQKELALKNKKKKKESELNSTDNAEKSKKSLRSIRKNIQTKKAPDRRNPLALIPIEEGEEADEGKIIEKTQLYKDR